MSPSRTASGRLWWGIPILLVLLAGLGALMPQIVAAVPHPPPVTTVGLPVFRFVRDVTSAITLGCLVVGGVLGPRPSPRVLRWSTWWALGWLVALISELILTYSDILAIDPGVDSTALWSFLSDVSVGRVFLWQAVAVLAVIGLSRAVISTPTAWAVVLCAAAGVAAPAFLGHGGLAGGHAAATISLALHLVSVSIWVGGLVAVVAWLSREPGRALTVLPRFSALALACFVAVAESGLLNASLRLLTPAQVLSSDYGALLLAKTTLILWLVAFGWQQRKRVIPTLDGEGGITVPLLARLAGWEFLAMGAAFAVGISMARIGPNVSSQSSWPVNPLMLVILGIGLPVALTQLWSAPAHWVAVRWARHYPDLVAITVTTVMLVMGVVGLPSALLGPELGAAVTAPLLVIAGLLTAVSLRGDRATWGAIAAGTGWVVVLASVAFFEHLRGAPSDRLPLLALSFGVAAASIALARLAIPLSAIDVRAKEFVHG